MSANDQLVTVDPNRSLGYRSRISLGVFVPSRLAIP
jgi:hypothetical protein